MGSGAVWSDLDRPPLRVRPLTRALVVPDGLWRELRVLSVTASTNSDVAAAALGREPEGLVVVAESQTAGRGRLDRTWSAPPRSGLTFSVLLRPGAVPRARWGWLPLLSGLAVAEAVRRVGEVPASVKWPNDVLVGERKLAGVLTEVVGDAVVVGIGLNVSLRPEELRVDTATSPGATSLGATALGATSLRIAEAATTDRDTVLRAVLRALEVRYRTWRDTGGTAPLADYLALSATVGRRVRAELPGGGRLEGDAVDVDSDGRLVVRGDAGADVAVGAGDVVHVRPVGEPG